MISTSNSMSWQFLTITVGCVCSKDCINWVLLSSATDETLKKARIMTGRFTGDPASECEHREVTKVKQKGNETEEEIVVRILMA